MVGGVPFGNGGVEPNPAISNAMTLRLRHRCGTSGFQAARDIPIPWRSTSGRPDPVLL